MKHSQGLIANLGALVSFALVGCSYGPANQPVDEQDGGSAWPTHLGSGSPACVGTTCLRAASCRPGQASAQFRAQTPPVDLRPGSRGWASVTFDNCSGTIWKTSSFSLRPAAPLDESTWAIARVALPADVPDGTGVTIPFELTAPDAPGIYPFTWGIAGDAVGMLEEHSPLVTVDVRFSADCSEPGPPARFQGWTFPRFVATSGKVTATITYANCSSVTWTTVGGYSLGSQAEPDNILWGVRRIELPKDVPSQTQVTIPLEVTAPKTPGAYPFAWKLVQEGVSWVDEPTPVATITALEPYDCGSGGPLSRFVREDGVPSLVNPGEAIAASVTFANCSTANWDAAFHVGAASPSNDGVWSAGRIVLPFTIAPGFAVTAPIHGHAPGTGSHPYRWTVVHDGASAIDEPSPAHTVEVRCLPSCGDHSCGADGCGGSCGSCDATSACDGAYCKELPHTLSCSHVQWWNSALTYGPYMSYGWWDTDLAVSSGTPVQLRHDSRLDKHGVYGWGYMPEFTDLVTGHRFRFLHLRPAYQYATSTGTVYPAGYVVGLSGGDTADTGLGPYSTGAHLCVQTLDAYRACFPTGHDACK